MAASGIDWEDAFVNVDHIPGGYDFPRHWEDRAADFRTTARAELDISYGSDARETLDIFLPGRASQKDCPCLFTAAFGWPLANRIGATWPKVR